MTLFIDERRRAMLAEMRIPFAPLREGADSAPDEDLSPAALVPAESRVAVGLGPAPASARGAVEDMQWEELRDAVTGCQACKLCGTRTQVVFGVGHPQAEWMVIGEAPGENEDRQGEPFVGQAGKLLDNMLKAIGLSRARNVYIANVLKCRPPGNRNPEPDEVAQCEPFLRRQVALVQPRIILAMGRFSVQTLLGTTEPIGKLRGRVHEYMGVPVVVTYHPAYLLRSLADKSKAWADLCLAVEVARGGQAAVGAPSRSSAT